MSLFFVYVLVGSAVGLDATQLQATPETLPIIEVNLAPPANPLPEVSAEIQVLEKARDALEQEKMAKLEAAYNAALEGAKSKISVAIGSAMQLFDRPPTLAARSTSFLALRTKREHGRASSGEGPNVRVKVLSVPPPDASIKSKLDAMEAKRADAEAQMLDQGIQEMGELTNVVVSELKESLQLQMSSLLIPTRGDVRLVSPAATFLATAERDVPGMPVPEGLPQELNVRVGSSDVPYPTIAGVAQDMETRRDTAEHLLRQRILELELKLLEAENELVKDALHKAVGSVLVRLQIDSFVVKRVTLERRVS